LFLLPGQSFSGTGIKELVIDCLDADDCGNPKDVVRVRAAGDVSGWAIQSKQNLAVSICPGDMANELARDITRV
jgi:hypothetical protein